VWGLRVWGSRFEVQNLKALYSGFKGLEVEGFGFKMLTCNLRVTARV
jgi:hypothetical protein